MSVIGVNVISYKLKSGNFCEWGEEKVAMGKKTPKNKLRDLFNWIVGFVMDKIHVFALKYHMQKMLNG